MLLFSGSVMSNSLQPHGLQQARLPSFTVSGACSNSCLLSQRCHPTISCCALLLQPSVFPSIRVLSNELALCSRWPKYWSFSFNISPSNKYSELLSFRIDWFDFLAVQGTLKSLLQHQFKSLSSLVLSHRYGQILISVHDYWKTRSFDPLIFRFFSI